MKRIISVTAIIFLQLLVQYCAAQSNEIRFNFVEGNNREPLDKITGITQDPQGYMWFSGQDAQCLYRYDGYRMISFKHDSLNTNSPGGTYLETVYADSSGVIWIGFFGTGLDQYKPSTKQFRHFRYSANDPNTLSNDSVTVVLRDSKGTIWVGTQNGLNRLDEKTGKFFHYHNEDGNATSLSSNVVRAIYEDHAGTLWIGTGFPFDKNKPEDGGLNRMEHNGKFTRFLHDPKNPHSLLNNKIRSIYEDSRGNFWIGTGSNGIHIMDRKNGTFERYVYNPNNPGRLSGPQYDPQLWFDHITFIVEDGSGAIWIGTYASGINRYDPQTKTITHYYSDKGFPDRSGWMAYTSRDGVLWISTQETNLFRIDPFYKPINNIVTGSPVETFHEDKQGSLWVGTDEKGLLQFDQHKKLIQQFSFDRSKQFSLFSNMVHSIFQEQEDTLLLSTANGIALFNKVTKHFMHFPYYIASIETVNILKDKQGFKWFATLGGLIKFNPKDTSIVQYHYDARDTGSISSERIVCLLQDRYDNIWAGTWRGGGINRLNNQSGKFSHYLKGSSISCIYQDAKGTIWAGTEKGLYYYNKNLNSFSAYFDPQSDIGTAAVVNIVEDDFKNLWIGTQRGIVKINVTKDETFIYGKKYEITPNSLSWGIYKTKKGEILVGNIKGFYAFFPEYLAIKTQSLKIIIADFYINNVSILPGKESVISKPIEEVSNIELKYNQNHLSFNFAIVDYRSPETNKMLSMLDGFDTTWRMAGTEKGADYFNVPPGKYIFRVKAFNSDGVMAEKSIAIIIDPPWWKTWWAYCIYGLVFIAGIFSIQLSQKKRIIGKERQKTQAKELAHAKEIEKAYNELKSAQSQLIQSEKMASLGELTAGIAHEIQNPLNFVNNFSEVNTELIEELQSERSKVKSERSEEDEDEILNDIQQNLQKILHHGKRADAIVKGMLQHSRSSTGTKEPTDINALADEYLRLAYHGLRAKDKTFNATLKTDFDHSIDTINIIPQDIGRVILNLINNAFYAVAEKKKNPQPLKGSEEYEPTITVSTKKNSDKILISVADNGNGMPQKVIDKIFQPFFTTKPTGQGTGLGLSLSYDIIKAHGGEIKVETKEEEGTAFIISLPG